MKKGFLLTLGVFFIASIVLILAIIVFRNAEESQERIFELGGSERVFDLHSSIDGSLKEIFDIYSNITIGIVNNSDVTLNVSFEDYVGGAFDDYAKDFNYKMINFKTFVEGEDGNIILNITSLNTTSEKMPLVISPHGINYTHENDAGRIKLNITPPGPPYAFSSYGIYINTSNIAVVGITGTPSGAGYSLSIIAEDNFGNSFNQIYNLDIALQNAFQVDLDTGTVNIDVENGTLIIKAPQEIFVRTSIGHLMELLEKTTVKYSGEIVNITIPNLGIIKLGSVVLK